MYRERDAFIPIIYICMCTCVYIYIYTHTYVYIYIYICISCAAQALMEQPANRFTILSSDCLFENSMPWFS